MLLKRINVENFKGIEKSTFEFDERFTLIMGNNGVGKTSVLEAIGIGLGGYIAGIHNVNTIHISQDDVRRIKISTGDSSKDIKYLTPTIITCFGNIHGKDITWTRSKGNFKSSTTVTSREIKKLAEDVTENRDKNTVLPVISYHSAARMWSQKRDKIKNVFNETDFSRIVGYTDCLEEQSNMKMITKWIMAMDYISYQQGRISTEYEVVKSAVGKFISSLNGKGDNPSIFYDKRSEELSYSSDGETLPIRLLSAGYRSLIGMVADIAYRMAILNPDLGENIVKLTPGVVLIDEIDLHIHPKWQWKIVEVLMGVFPKIQFIATTHSPIIIASCKNRRIINLFDKDKSTPELELGSENMTTAFGWKVNDVLNSYMGVAERTMEVNNKLKELKSLYIKNIKKTITQYELEKFTELKEELHSILPEGDTSIEFLEIESIEDVILGSR